MEACVGIVGAGPVGLACALRLASFGVSAMVLEAEPSLVRQGSKACLIQGDVLEILDKCGCAAQIAHEGVTWHVARTYVRGKVISTTVYPKPIGFGPFVNISQYRIEQVLLEKLSQTKGSSVRWGHRVVAVAQDEDGVTVTAETPDGRRLLRFSYLAACDGVRSSLRELTGVRWTGYTHGDRFLITDVRADIPLAQERHFHYDSPFNPGRQLVIHAQPDNVWRIDWQLAASADIESELRNGGIDRRIRKVIGDVPYHIEWLSTYRFHQRVVEKFRVGRIFFAGDAAHALPPYGARGMNSGLQDVDNLAWKLGMVVAGQAGDELLDTYHTERYAAAAENLRVTEETIRFMVPPTRPRRWLRNLTLQLATRLPSARHRVNSGRMAEPFVYPGSPSVPEIYDCPLSGRFAPDLRVTVNGEQRRLRTLLGRGFVILGFAAADDEPGFASAIPEEVAGLGVGGVFVSAAAHKNRLPPHVTAALAPGGPGHFGEYQPGSWYVVRPDGHIGAGGRWEAGWEIPGIREVLARAVLSCGGAAVMSSHQVERQAS